MAVEVTLQGNGAWAGGSAELSNYSVDEEATPLNAADTSGAVGAMTFSAVEVEDSPLLFETPFELSDASNGITSGVIRGLRLDNGIVEMTGESPLGLMVPDKQIKPRRGTLAAVLTSLLNECNVKLPIMFEAGLNAATTQVVLQGWYGSPWDYLKMLGTSMQFEVSLVSGAIVFRKPRNRFSSTETDLRRTVSIDRGELATNIEIIRYNNQYIDNGMIYPYGGWNSDLEIFSVDAEEALEVEVSIDVSVLSVEQPECVLFVPKNYTGPSVYAVAGNDGLPMPPKAWKDFGGKVEVEIGRDTKTLILKLTGPALPELGPFTLSVNSGASDSYSALRLRGSGVGFKPETFTFPTGADSRYTTSEVGITIDNPTVQSDAQFATLALTAARQYSAPVRTLAGEALVMNRPGETGFIKYMTFADFDAARADTYTFQSFKTEFAGKTFAQIGAQLREASDASGQYENQAFGNVVGSMVRDGDTWYRVRRTTITPAGATYEAEADTTFEQVKSAMTGKTFAQLKTQRTGMTFSEIALTPLRNT